MARKQYFNLFQKTNHLVFWPPFLLLLSAVIFNFVAPDAFIQSIESAQRYLLTNFGWLFTTCAFPGCFVVRFYIVFAIWKRPTRRSKSRTIDVNVELVCDHDLHHHRRRHLVLVDSRTDSPLPQPSFFAWRTASQPGLCQIRNDRHVFALDIHSLRDLLRGIADVRLCLLQHETAVFHRFHAGAHLWRSGQWLAGKSDRWRFASIR